MEGQLKRAALGRVAFIGELYNARKETFTSQSLFRSNFPGEWIKDQKVEQMIFDYKFTDDVSERFELLKVQGEIQVGVLLGLVSVGGSGSFLTEELKSDRSVACSLICNLNTVCEKFIAPFAEALPYLDLQALEDPEHTHFVSEVNWGANFILSLVANCKEESMKKKVKGKLELKLLQLKFQLSGGGDGEKMESSLETNEEIQIKVNADVVPNGHWPTTVEGFREFLENVPKLLKTANGGKGKALAYTMIPLNSLRKMAKLSLEFQVVVKVVEESFLALVVFLFEDIAHVKRKLNDLVTDMGEMKKYVKEEDLKTVREHREGLAQKESQLKMIILEDWVQVKSGEKEVKELVRKVERFKSRDLNLNFYEEYLESSSGLLKKLASVRCHLSKGVTYLGRGDTFEGVLSQHLSHEFLVMLLTPETEEEDASVRTSTSHFFLTEASNPRQNTKYVVVDFDYQKGNSFMGSIVTAVKCVHLNGSTVLSWDAYADYVADLESCFVRLRADAEMDVIKHKPGNRVPIEMVCPSKCSPEAMSWICFHCRATVEYGFDEKFYCCCGGGQVADFEYRCSHPKHSANFVPGNIHFIEKELSALRPFPEINVLVIGQSGVGKSTWINAIVNYLNYETLEEARHHGVICTIPTSFPMWDAKTYKEHVVVLGEDQNENTTIGHSTTQVSHTYSFLWQKRLVRIIDTPGLADTRGIEKDKENLKNIINHIRLLRELHAVCILLKASDNMMNVIFTYCLNELLSHLHKSIAKNVVFCYTNARNTFYGPGPAHVLLRDLLDKLGVENLSLGPHNTFCLENEAFVFLCSLTNSEITHDPVLIPSFTQSWQLSLKETKRLFNTIRDFKPHALQETISLVTARNRILNLTKPIAEISKMIQINLAAIERKKVEMRESTETIEELMKKLEFMEIYLESVALDYPRTVCTSPSCVDYISFSSVDVKEIFYRTHCHERCYLENVEEATVNNSRLRGCTAMGWNGTCSNCGCGWENHMHLTYSQVRAERRVIDKRVEKEIHEKKSEKERKEALVNKIGDKIRKYKEDQETIIQASVKFGLFLRENAIAVYNDSVADYIEYLIKEEEKKPHKSETEKKLLENLKGMLDHYNAEVHILTETLQKGEDSTAKVGIQEVLKLEQDLYKLEMVGDLIKKFSDCGRTCENKASQYQETRLNISKHKTSTVAKLKKFCTTQYENFKSQFR